MFFLRKCTHYPSSLIFIHPASVLSYIDLLTVVSIVQWLSRPPQTRKVASSNLAPNTLPISLNGVNQYKVLSRESMGFD